MLTLQTVKRKYVWRDPSPFLWQKSFFHFLTVLKEGSFHVYEKLNMAILSQLELRKKNKENQAIFCLSLFILFNKVLKKSVRRASD